MILQKKTFSALLLATIFSHAAHATLPIEHWQQSDGAQVWFVHSNALPMVDVHIAFDAGSRRESPAQAGLAQATALMSGKGIAAPVHSRNAASSAVGAMDENALGAAWADVGASFAASAGTDSMSWTLRTLSRTDLLERSVQLAAAQLARPALDAAVWQRERQRWSAAIAEANTRPATIARRAFAQAVYGTHPYGYQVSAATLADIDIAAMQRWRSAHLLPCRARVSIVGDITRERAQSLAEQLLAGLNAQRPPHAAPCPALPAVPQVQPLGQSADIRIPFAPTQQAHILVGQPGIARTDADYFAVLVGNHILGGGGFSSRLVEQVREKRGLTYGVSSSFAPGLHAGAFTIGMQTRADQAAQALELTRAVLREFIEHGPTQEELAAAQANLVGGFALGLDSNRELLGALANIAAHNLPLDYLNQWTAHIQALTVSDIRTAMQRHLNPEKMVTVVLGAKE